LAGRFEDRIGTEHVVELDPQSGLVAKTTQPPGFGLIPELKKLPIVENLRNAERDAFREVIEFFPATPLARISHTKASTAGR